MWGLGTATLDKAVTVKLTRTLAIIPITLVLAFTRVRRERAAGVEGAKVNFRAIFPFFILWFVVASVITTVALAHEVLWLDVHELDLVGIVEDVVGNPLAHDDARNRAHAVVETLEMLHVDGGVHVDTCREEFLDVLVALRMA